MIDAEYQNSTSLKGKKVYFKRDEELSRHEPIKINYGRIRKNQRGRK
jgi:hypothetical protein